MSTIRRVYPIRKSKARWFIRLFANHDCSLHSEESCNKNKCIEDTLVQISDFNVEKPMGINGPLLNENEIVIPDRKINITFEFPLINVACITIYSKNKDGFTLKDLILTIKSLYTHIYQEEEKTATQKTYDLEKLCEFCIFDRTPLINYISNSKKTNDDTECPICYNEFNEEQLTTIRCGHKFHQNCISEWIHFGGKTCPICRTSIKECKDCNGKMVIQFQYTGKVIPVEQRGIILNRNLTNGKYGIYGYDLENLFLEGFWYDKRNKNLRLFVVS